MRKIFIYSIFFCIFLANFIDASGTLEIREGQQILHISGTPYELGYQHGSLLKKQIARNIQVFINTPSSNPDSELLKRTQAFQAELPKLLAHIHPRFIEEMKGLADGSGIPYQKILMLNLLPEMFHCSGITVQGKASVDGDLYHVRVLDYAIGKNLQETAVLIIAEPESGYPFLNVTYAGFIGSVTGMNAKKIALGEVGAQGYGNWDGVPMAFLMREVLENASSLEDAYTIFTTSPRTCEYFYIVSDGNSGHSFGLFATSRETQVMFPGAPYKLKDAETYGSLENCLVVSGLNKASKHALTLERLQMSFGMLDPKILQEIIRRPVAADSNLHNVIFAPNKLKLWVSHAGPLNEPACDQEYHEFDLSELLK